MDKKMDFDSNWRKRKKKKESEKIKQKQGRKHHHGFWEVSHSKGTASTHAEIAQEQTPALPSCHTRTEGLSKWGFLIETGPSSIGN